MSNKRETQTTRLLEYLEKGHTIDGILALRQLGIFRLPSRILNLKKLGYNLDKGWNYYVSELYNEQYRMRTYRLLKEGE